MRSIANGDRIRSVEAGISVGWPVIDAPRQTLRPKTPIFANGTLHNVEQAVAALDDGADIVTLGRGRWRIPTFPGVCLTTSS